MPDTMACFVLAVLTLNSTVCFALPPQHQHTHLDAQQSTNATGDQAVDLPVFDAAASHADDSRAISKKSYFDSTYSTGYPLDYTDGHAAHPAYPYGYNYGYSNAGDHSHEYENRPLHYHQANYAPYKSSPDFKDSYGYGFDYDKLEYNYIPPRPSSAYELSYDTYKSPSKRLYKRPHYESNSRAIGYQHPINGHQLSSYVPDRYGSEHYTAAASFPFPSSSQQRNFDTEVPLEYQVYHSKNTVPYNTHDYKKYPYGYVSRAALNNHDSSLDNSFEAVENQRDIGFLGNGGRGAPFSSRQFFGQPPGFGQASHRSSAITFGSGYGSGGYTGSSNYRALAQSAKPHNYNSFAPHLRSYLGAGGGGSYEQLDGMDVKEYLKKYAPSPFLNRFL